MNGLDDIPVNNDDRFGHGLIAGDFNNDGFDDLAIGAPGSVVDGMDGAGAVHVLYGSLDGLTPSGSQTWTQESFGINDDAAAGDQYGRTLSSGDYNHDGYDDLAVGIPYETVGGDDDAGAVNIIFGSSGGLKSTIISGGKIDETLTQDTYSLFAAAQPDERFGSALETGDFNGDDYDDLAVGTPYEDFPGGYDSAGTVQIFFGSGDGLVDLDVDAIFPQEIYAGTPGVDNALEAGDLFGFSLAAAEMNGDEFDDLAIGVPYETHGVGGGALIAAGAVNVVFGTSDGLDAASGAPIWTQDSDSMKSEAEAGEFFGWSLEAADFDNDGHADLAVGVPYDNVLGVQIGSVHILYSDDTGPSAARDLQLFDPHNPELNDAFGYSMTAVDTNGDSYMDLTVGAYNDDPIGVAAANAGSVFLFHSNQDGLELTDNQMWYQGHNGLDGTPQIADRFGSNLP
jgi:hypothetical protein